MNDRRHPRSVLDADPNPGVARTIRRVEPVASGPPDPDAPLTPSARRRAWVAPGVLLFVALNQITFAKVADLAPWKGGGFGMFSSYQGYVGRFVKYHGVTEGGEKIQIRRMRSLSKYERKMKVFPSESHAREIATELANSGRPPGFDAVSVELWTTILNGNRFVSHKVKEFRFALEEHSVGSRLPTPTAP